MIQHISIGHHSISLTAIYLDSKDSGTYHHAALTVLLQLKLPKIGHFLAYQIIISLNILDLIRDLILEWRPMQKFPLFPREKDRKIRELLW